MMATCLYRVRLGMTKIQTLKPSNAGGRAMVQRPLFMLVYLGYRTAQPV